MMRSQDSYDFSKLKRIVNKKKVNLRKCKNVMIPINMKDSHWFLMCLSLTTNTFYIIDSMESFCSKDQIDLYVDMVRQFM